MSTAVKALNCTALKKNRSSFMVTPSILRFLVRFENPGDLGLTARRRPSPLVSRRLASTRYKILFSF